MWWCKKLLQRPKSLGFMFNSCVANIAVTRSKKSSLYNLFMCYYSCIYSLLTFGSCTSLHWSHCQWLTVDHSVSFRSRLIDCSDSFLQPYLQVYPFQSASFIAMFEFHSIQGVMETLGLQLCNFLKTCAHTHKKKKSPQKITVFWTFLEQQYVNSQALQGRRRHL